MLLDAALQEPARTAGWNPVPPAAREAFPSVSAIMRQRGVKRARAT